MKEILIQNHRGACFVFFFWAVSYLLSQRRVYTIFEFYLYLISGYQINGNIIIS